MSEIAALRERLEQRLKALHAELEAGDKMLADLDARRANLRDTLLRIAGAITVLDEELALMTGDSQGEPDPLE